LKGVVNRCGVLTGPWQMGKVDQGVVVLWVARHVYGGRLSYIGYGGTGKQVRDMLHIDDLLRLVEYQIDHLDELSGETFNVGGGRAVSASLRELTAICEEVTGNRVDIGKVPEDRAADIRYYVTDHTRVTERTGWRPGKDVRAIVEDIHAWIRANRDALRPILD
jgi:CDP-paratose 2-epimerase